MELDLLYAGCFGVGGGGGGGVGAEFGGAEGDAVVGVVYVVEEHGLCVVAGGGDAVAPLVFMSSI